MKHLFLILLICCTQLASAVTVTINKGDAHCGNNNGWAEAVVSGGSAPYMFQWNTGALTYRIDGLLTGVYSLLVTDANGDTVSASVTIANIQNLALTGFTYYMPGGTVGATSPCGSNCNGVAYLLVDSLGGTAPYTITAIINSGNPSLVVGNYNYQGQNIPTITNICSADVFEAVVTDANGCSSTEYGPAPIGVENFWFDSSAVAPACAGLANGTIKLTFPNIPYLPGIQYSWTGPTSGGNSFFNGTIRLMNVPAGTYMFHMVNNVANACDTTFTITVPDIGSNCGQINGAVILDSIPNCALDAGEYGLENQLVEFTPGPYYAVTNAQGQFHIDLPSNTYTASSLGTAIMKSVCQVSGLVIAAPGDSIGGVILGDSVSAGNDIQLWLGASAARPGFNFSVYGSVRNNSYYPTDTVTIALNYDPMLTYVSASVPCAVLGSGQLELKLVAGVAGLQNANFSVSLNVPANPALIGTTINTWGTASMSTTELNTANNSFSITKTITGSYDPNEKIGYSSAHMRGVLLCDIDSTMHYEVHFQNTGTDTAFNIVVVDTLDLDYNIASFNMEGASHSYRWELSGRNILKVYFDNILLPDSGTNQWESDGVFGYSISIKPWNTYPSYPFTIENTAHVYFDFNPPVATNTETTLVEISVGLHEQEVSSVMVYPNPVYDVLNLNLSAIASQHRVSVVDITGKMLSEQVYTGNRISIPVQQLQTGMYLVKVSDTQSGNYAVQRFTKY